MLVGQVDDGLQVAVRRRDDRLRHRMADGRDDDPGDLAGVLGEDALQIGDITVLELLGELVDGLWYAAVMLHAPVAPAVVAAARDLVAAGVCAHRPHGRVGRVRPGLHQDGLLATWHDVGQPLLELVLERLDEAEAEALVHLGLGGVVDLGLDIAEDDRPVGAQHVDVLVAVHVEDVAAPAVSDEHGVLADHEVVGPADAADAARRQALGVLQHAHRPGEVQLGRALHGLRHWVSFHHCSVEDALGVRRRARSQPCPSTDARRCRMLDDRAASSGRSRYARPSCGIGQGRPARYSALR